MEEPRRGDQHATNLASPKPLRSGRVQVIAAPLPWPPMHPFRFPLEETRRQKDGSGKDESRTALHKPNGHLHLQLEQESPLPRCFTVSGSGDLVIGSSRDPSTLVCSVSASSFYTVKRCPRSWCLAPADSTRYSIGICIFHLEFIVQQSPACESCWIRGAYELEPRWTEGCQACRVRTRLPRRAAEFGTTHQRVASPPT